MKMHTLGRVHLNSAIAHKGFSRAKPEKASLKQRRELLENYQHQRHIQCSRFHDSPSIGVQICRAFKNLPTHSRQVSLRFMHCVEAFPSIRLSGFCGPLAVARAVSAIHVPSTMDALAGPTARCDRTLCAAHTIVQLIKCNPHPDDDAHVSGWVFFVCVRACVRSVCVCVFPNSCVYYICGVVQRTRTLQ